MRYLLLAKPPSAAVLKLFVAAALAVLAACASVEPVPYHDHREEGPKGGLLSGQTGEFIIYERSGESEESAE